MSENNQNQEKAITQAVVHLKDLPALKLADDPRVHKKFVAIFNLMNGNDKGEHVYEMEKFHFTKQLTENKALQECTPLSLYGVFVDVAAQGLSFDPNKKLCYIIPYSMNAGTRDNPKWEKRASLTISPYGELYLRQMYGQIKSAENPEIVYDGEEFTIIQNGNGKIVNHTIKYPRPNTKIIACYFRFIKADGTVDYGVMDLKDVERLKGFSERKNGAGKANALYGGGEKEIDKGFLMAKTIKHAFRAYPKVKLKGQFTQLEPEQNEEDKGFDYELEEEDTPQVKQNNSSPETVIMTNHVDENTGEVIEVEDDLTNF